MTISKTFTYKTFNPNTNDFDKEVKVVRKEVDAKTTRAFKRYDFFQHLYLLLWFPFLIASITLACLADNGGGWQCIVGAVGFLLLLIYASYQILACETKGDVLEKHFRENNFEDEEQECETYNAEQEVIEAEWREAHPFEEKIRMAKERGSSVDIAEMIKHYEEYIKK